MLFDGGDLVQCGIGTKSKHPIWTKADAPSCRSNFLRSKNYKGGKVNRFSCFQGSKIIKISSYDLNVPTTNRRVFWRQRLAARSTFN
jgi:hypothetical protein